MNGKFFENTKLDKVYLMVFCWLLLLSRSCASIFIKCLQSVGYYSVCACKHDLSFNSCRYVTTGPHGDAKHA